MLFVVETCAIIHNIIVTEQKHRYRCTRKERLNQKEADEVVYHIEFHSLDDLRIASSSSSVPFESEMDNNQLKEVLVENM